VEKWRENQAVEKTKITRPDLFEDPDWFFYPLNTIWMLFKSKIVLNLHPIKSESSLNGSW
jgi:hypothetical protein